MRIRIRTLAIAAAVAIASAGCGGEDAAEPIAGSTGEPGPPVATLSPADPAEVGGAGEQADVGTGAGSSPPAREEPVPTSAPVATPTPTHKSPPHEPAQTSQPHEPVVVVDDPDPVPSPTPEPLVCGTVEVSGEQSDSVPVDTDGDGEPDDCIPALDLNLGRPEPKPTAATSEPVVVAAETTVVDAGSVPESEWVEPPSFEDVECPEHPCLVGETASGDPVVRGVRTQEGPCQDELEEWMGSPPWLEGRRQAATEVRSEWADRDDREGLETAILLRGAELEIEFYEACLERQGEG